ncbi:hypothetical protein [Woeseia oceani]|uniref:hypothetical protein n=1 Tax=Woeseia oceani TaxID=1548547 RepID=UPI0012EB003B|nr:hypothetical protein [Woeseia oceani]
MDTAALRHCAFVGLVLSVSACGTLYELDVSAHKSNVSAPGNTYIILSNDQDFPLESPQFDQYASQLERAMAEHGYQRIAEDQLNAASFAIYVSADISDPKKSYHTVSRAMYETPYTQGASAAARNTGSSSSGGQGAQSAGQPTVLDLPPVEQLSGYEQNAFATTVFTKHMSLVAVDLQKYLSDIKQRGRSNAVPEELWSVDVETTGSVDDLLEAVPVMIAAAEPYLGDSTEEQVRISLSEGDKRVRRIRAAHSINN